MLTRSQQWMVQDGLPADLILTREERAALWRANPPRAMPLFNMQPPVQDEQTAAFVAKLAENKRLKSLNQIAKMKNRFASKAIDHSKFRWDARRNKFVEDILHGGAKTLAPRAITSVLPRDEGQVAKCDDGLHDVKAYNARQIAELNGVWKPEYGKLTGGLLVMTIKNKLKNLVKKGLQVKWLD